MTTTSDKETGNRDNFLAHAAMRWSGWGSPVGLAILLTSIGLFICSFGFFLVCLHWAGLLATP